MALVFKVIVKQLQVWPHYVPWATPYVIFFRQTNQEIECICKPSWKKKNENYSPYLEQSKAGQIGKAIQLKYSTLNLLTY